MELTCASSRCTPSSMRFLRLLVRRRRSRRKSLGPRRVFNCANAPPKARNRAKKSSMHHHQRPAREPENHHKHQEQQKRHHGKKVFRHSQQGSRRRTPPASRFRSRKERVGGTKAAEAACVCECDRNRRAPQAPAQMKARRAARCNGAVLYVARALKGGGTGPAAPCTRCLRWCAWAGIRRVFHWDGILGRWERVRVADAGAGIGYATAADVRLAAGSVSTFALLRWCR